MGNFRSIFYPVKTDKRNSYIIGVDVTVDSIKSEIKTILIKTISIGFIIFLISNAIIFWLAKNIIPIPIKHTLF